MPHNFDSVRHIPKDDFIIRQGDHGETAFILESGRVEIIHEAQDGSITHSIQGPGTLFGELSLLSGDKRAASVKALENCTLLTITKEDINHRMKSADPVLKLLMKVLIDRCRQLIHTQTKSGNANLMPADEMYMNHDGNTEDDSQAVHTDKDVMHSIRLETALKKALDNNELCLHYQPIINLKTGGISGFEALMRWNHPTEGLIPPDEFIPLAEDTGLIEKLSEWALIEATSALKRIQDLPIAPDNLYMSVNFSSHDLSKPHFLSDLDHAVKTMKLTPGQVKLEITERLLILQPEVAAQTLQDCRDAGFSIAIDDFGTGYSSLSYLQDFPIDTLKIDQAFIKKMVADTTSEELVRTIVHLGKSLGMDIIAEGAETEQEVEKLKELDCDMVQGYFFARPMEEQKIENTMATWESKIS